MSNIINFAKRKSELQTKLKILNTQELIAENYIATLRNQDGCRLIFDVKNLKNGHSYTTGIKKLRLDFFKFADGSSANNEYREPSCNCPRFKFSADKDCPHILAMLLEVERIENYKVEFKQFAEFKGNKTFENKLKAA